MCMPCFVCSCASLVCLCHRPVILISPSPPSSVSCVLVNLGCCGTSVLVHTFNNCPHVKLNQWPNGPSLINWEFCPPYTNSSQNASLKATSLKLFNQPL